MYICVGFLYLSGILCYVLFVWVCLVCNVISILKEILSMLLGLCSALISSVCVSSHFG